MQTYIAANGAQVQSSIPLNGSYVPPAGQHALNTTTVNTVQPGIVQASGPVVMGGAQPVQPVMQAPAQQVLQPVTMQPVAAVQPVMQPAAQPQLAPNQAVISTGIPTPVQAEPNALGNTVASANQATYQPPVQQAVVPVQPQAAPVAPQLFDAQGNQVDAQGNILQSTIAQPVAMQTQGQVVQPQVPTTTQPSVVIPATLKDSLAQAGINADNLVAELHANNGKLTQGTTDVLTSKFGAGAQDIIDNTSMRYENESLKQAESNNRNTLVNDMYTKAVGGDANKAILNAWVDTNLNQFEKSAVNLALKSGTLQEVQSALDTVINRYNATAQTGEPAALAGNQAVPTGVPGAYTAQEFLQAQLDPRYNVDPAYTQDADNRRVAGQNAGM